MSGRGDLRRTAAMFRRFAVGERPRMLSALLLMALEAVTAIAVPALIGGLITVLKDGTRLHVGSFSPPASATIPLLAAAIVVATAVDSLADSLSDVSLAKVGRALGYHTRTALFAHLQRLSLAFHVRRSTGDVLTRITGDVQALEEFVVDSVKDLVGSAMLLAGTLTYLFLRSWRIALLAVVIVPLLAAVSGYFARRIKVASRQLRAREGDLASTAQEMLTTISLVQTYGRAAREQRRFDEESRSARAAVLQTARLDAMFGFTVSVLEALVIATVVVVGSRLVIGHSIDAGQLVAFILLIQGMFKPTRRIIKQWNTVAKLYASVDRIGELLEREPAVRDLPGASPAPRLRGAVEFRDVTFAYQPQLEDAGDGGEPVRLTLRSLSFTLAAGEVVALVGHSGAGKSTIAQLLPRLYDPQEGAVLLDGHDIRAFTLESLRAQISMVLQETVLLRGSVADNIAYGREGASRADVVAAAKSAQAHEFISALPDGYDTALGERAATLSGGQRQRLSIARAFIRDTPIVVLDEPTTGLDAQASAAVAEALQTLLHGRSAVIVSHDLNLIRSVDRILVLSGGRILEEGTPSDLLASGGLYAQLYASQFGEAIAESGAVVPSPGAGAEEDESFRAVLLDAVPRVASSREYQHLTGWAPRAQPSRAGAGELDALGATLLRRSLPGLVAAVDPDRVARHLAAIGGGRWQVHSCVVDKVVVEPPDGATLRYRLRVRGRDGGAESELLVGGRLFASSAQLQSYAVAAREAARAVERRDGLDDGALVAAVPELGLVLHAAPVDPGLPGLVAATDSEALPALLERVLPRPLPELVVETCTSEVVKYAVGDHAVVRLEVLWRVPRSGRSVRQVVYGKVLRADAPELRPSAVMDLCRFLAASASGPVPFLLPRPLAHLPVPDLSLSEALPGTADVAPRVRAAVAPPQSRVALAGARDALIRCAAVAAALHVPVPLAAARGDGRGPRARSLEGEVRRVEAQLTCLATAAPALAARLGRNLRAVADGTGDVMAPAVGHGDLTMSEVLLDGPVNSVFDLGSACVAEPALDLGRFTAHLEVVAQRSGAGATDGQHLRRAFLDEYAAHRPHGERRVLGERTRAYRELFLVEQASRAWCQLKPDRVEASLAALGTVHR